MSDSFVRDGGRRENEGLAPPGGETCSFTTSPVDGSHIPRRSTRPHRTGTSTYSGCHSVASDGIVNRDTGTGLLRMGCGSLSMSMGGICGSPIFGARRNVVEGIR